ncbi:hypothetical protein ABK040_003511 [Willaertia magna]
MAEKKRLSVSEIVDNNSNNVDNNNDKKCRNPSEWMDILVLSNIQSFLYDDKENILSLRLLCKHITNISNQVNSIITILLHFKNQVIPKILKSLEKPSTTNKVTVTTINNKVAVTKNNMLTTTTPSVTTFNNNNLIKEVNIDLINSYGMGFLKRLNGYLRHLLFLFYLNQIEIYLNEFLMMDLMEDNNIDLELLQSLLQHFEKRNIVKEFYCNDKWLSYLPKEKYLKDLNLIIKNNNVQILQKIFKENLIELIEYQSLKGNTLIYIESIIKVKNNKNNYFILSLQYFEKNGKKDFILTQLNFNYTKKFNYLNLNFNNLTKMKSEIFENSLLFKECSTVTYQDFLKLLFIISNIDYNLISSKEKGNNYVVLKEPTEIPTFLKGSILIEDELLVKYFFNQFNGNSLKSTVTNHTSTVDKEDDTLKNENVWILQQKEFILHLLEKVLSLCSRNNWDYKIDTNCILQEMKKENIGTIKLEEEEEKPLKARVGKRKKKIIISDDEDNDEEEEEKETKKKDIKKLTKNQNKKKHKKDDDDDFIVSSEEEEEDDNYYNNDDEEEEEEEELLEEEEENEEDLYFNNDNFNDDYFNENFNIEILPLECFTLYFYTLNEFIHYQQFKIILENLETKERFLFYYKMKYNNYFQKENYHLTCHYKDLNNNNTVSNNNDKKKNKSDKGILFFSSSFVNNGNGEESDSQKVKLSNCLPFYNSLSKYDLKVTSALVTNQMVKKIFSVVKKLVKLVEEKHCFNSFTFGENGKFLFENKMSFTKLLTEQLTELNIVKYANFHGFGKPKPKPPRRYYNFFE